MAKKNVFVLGMDERNRERLAETEHSATCEFHQLLTYEETHGAASHEVRGLLDKARSELKSFHGKVDGILGFWDFPVTAILPILAHELDVPSPSLEAVLKCEHKFWSRQLQRELVPEVTPRFARFSPLDEDVKDTIGLPYPYWVKPVKSFAGHLGFRIDSDDDLASAMAQMRQGVGRFEEPFDEIIAHADVPDDIRSGGFGIAEEIISGGHQCTVEVFSHGGETARLGVFDTIRIPGGSSFSRYVYPSKLPEQVIERMVDVVRRFLQGIDLQPLTCNIEFFWDEDTDALHLLEANPRSSQSHFGLYHLVDGKTPLDVYTSLALGERPTYEKGEGAYPVACRLFLRHFGDARVLRAPHEEDLRKIYEAFPGVQLVFPTVREGMLLSELTHEDSYSARLCMIDMGGESEEDIAEKFDEMEAMLGFELDELGGEGHLIKPSGEETSVEELHR